MIPHRADESPAPSARETTARRKLESPTKGWLKERGHALASRQSRFHCEKISKRSAGTHSL
eukprot:6356539-Pyramimonas_sp.AAC.1